MLTSSQIRQQFLDFFEKKHGHTVVPSSSVVPVGDDTLLFTNAGMNQFKDVFLGVGDRPYKRAVDTQKCIRAGGKHNDLDDVGKDTYHHTFFEMLGNWSFGDYFKKEAIAWAWQLLTEVWGMDKDRLHVTVFEGDSEQKLERDDEAAELWRKVAGVDPSHVHLGSRKDNFWEMGETGPCGPCTEIHIDRTPDKSGARLVNKGSPKVIEIWNLVFIQFNRNPDKSLTPLKAKHVDTGMGFERVTAVLQGKDSNYDTDVFTPIFGAIQKLTGAPGYTGKLEDLKDTAYRVIADHIRALTFAITDGGVPSNEKRGYVLRSILRRAERYGRQYLNTRKPFMHELVPTVVELMGGPFPELKHCPGKVSQVIFQEEESFIKTLDRGIKLFQDVVSRTKEKGSSIISGVETFDLHTTYGFFPDITEQMAAEVGMKVDLEAYKKRMDQFREESGKDRKLLVITAVKGDLPPTDDSPKYQGQPIDAKVVGWVEDNTVITEGRLETGARVALLLDRTNHYAEQGGQVGDMGGIIKWKEGEFQVEDTQRLGNSVLHLGTIVSGSVKVGQKVRISLASPRRLDTMRNHTATHLLNLALRKVLGGHIDQKGSLVDADKTRFDFSHSQAMAPAEMAEVERLVNEQISADLPVTPIDMSLAEAKKLPGVRAVFGEKYPDPVRVLLIGPEKTEEITSDYSVEFCGGTHLSRTSQIGYFKILSQEAVGKGVRRLTAVTGRGAAEEVQKLSGVVEELKARLQCNPEQLPARIDSLQEEVKKLQTQLKKGAAVDVSAAADALLAAALEINGSKIITGELPAAPRETMLQQLDRLRQKARSAAVVLGWVEEGKVSLLAGMTEDVVKKGLQAGKIIGEVAKMVGGKGGGRPDMAQAGGSDPTKLADALALARKLAAEKLGT